jgi:hypothetical protein
MVNLRNFHAIFRRAIFRADAGSHHPEPGKMRCAATGNQVQETSTQPKQASKFRKRARSQNRQPSSGNGHAAKAGKQVQETGKQVAKSQKA